MNVKLKRLKLKYGYESWGIYWHFNELVASELEPPRKQDCTFEGDPFILADSFTNEKKVKEILDFCVEIGLLTKNDKGQYVNLKLLERLDETTKRKSRKNYNKTENPEQSGTIRNNPAKIKENKIKENKIKENKIKSASKNDALKTLAPNHMTLNSKDKDFGPGHGLDENRSKLKSKNDEIGHSRSSSGPVELSVEELIKSK